MTHGEPEEVLVERSRPDFHLAFELAPYVQGMREDLSIFSVCFVLGKDGASFLGELARPGTRVRVVTHSLASTTCPWSIPARASTAGACCAAAWSCYTRSSPEPDAADELRNKRSGFGLSGSTKATLHTKAFVFDRERPGVSLAGLVLVEPRL